MSMIGTLPDGARAFFDKAVEVLGLGRIVIEIRPAPLDDLKGEARLNWRTQRAIIHIDETAVEGPDLDVTILHELLHVVQLPTHQSVNRIIDLVKAGSQEHCQELWADGNEEMTELLARSMAPFIRSLLPPIDTTDKKEVR